MVIGQFDYLLIFAFETTTHQIELGTLVANDLDGLGCRAAPVFGPELYPEISAPVMGWKRFWNLNSLGEAVSASDQSGGNALSQHLGYCSN